MVGIKETALGRIMSMCAVISGTTAMLRKRIAPKSITSQSTAVTKLTVRLLLTM